MGRILVTKYHLIALGLVGILPHSTGLWNFELKAGIGVQIIANLVAAAAFIIFYGSIAELTSTFPFAGGSYAFARCTVGFFLGYLIGCIEVLYYALLLVWTNGALIVFIRRNNVTVWRNENCIIMALFISNFIICISKKWVYNLFVVLAIFGVCMNLIYIFGSIQFLDFNSWAYLPNHTEDDTLQLLLADDDNGFVDPHSPSKGVIFNIVTQRICEAFSNTLWTYKGLENVNLMSEDVVAPRKMIPLAQMIGVAALVLFNASIPVIGASMYPGIERLIKLSSPNSPGYSQIFNVTHNTATMIALPILYGMSTVICYSLTKLIAAMAESRLFPHVLARRVWSTRTPIFALGVACCAALLILIVMALVDQSDFPQFSTILGVYALFTYCMQLISFIVLRLKLSSFPREFHSPFGIPGALFCMVIFLAGIACSLAVPHRTVPTIVVGIIYVAVVSMYYFWFAKHEQTFSVEEKAVVLPAHVGIKNANEYIYNRFPCLGAIVAVFFRDRRSKAGRFRFWLSRQQVVPVVETDAHRKEAPLAAQNNHPIMVVRCSSDFNRAASGDCLGDTSDTSGNKLPHQRKTEFEMSAVPNTSCVANVSRLSTVYASKSSCEVNTSSYCLQQDGHSEMNDFSANNDRRRIVELPPLRSGGQRRSFQQRHEEYLPQQHVRGFESSSNVDVEF